MFANLFCGLLPYSLLYKSYYIGLAIYLGQTNYNVLARIKKLIITKYQHLYSIKLITSQWLKAKNSGEDPRNILFP